MRSLQGKLEYLVFIEHIAAWIGVYCVKMLLSVHIPGVVRLGALHRPVLIDELIQLNEYGRLVREPLFMQQGVPEVHEIGLTLPGVDPHRSRGDLGLFGRVEVVHEDEADEDCPDDERDLFHYWTSGPGRVVSIVDGTVVTDDRTCVVTLQAFLVCRVPPLPGTGHNRYMSAALEEPSYSKRSPTFH